MICLIFSVFKEDSYRFLLLDVPDLQSRFHIYLPSVVVLPELTGFLLCCCGQVVHQERVTLESQLELLRPLAST